MNNPELIQSIKTPAGKARQLLDNVPGRPFSVASAEFAVILYNCYQEQKNRRDLYLTGLIHPERVALMSISPEDKFIKSIDEITTKAAGRQSYDYDKGQKIGGDGEPVGKAKIWLKLAEQLIASRIDPRVFIEAQFNCLAAGDKTPFPEMLLTSQALENIDRANAAAMVQIAESLQWHTGRFRTCVHTAKHVTSHKRSDYEAWAYVIGDLDVELTALFRFCIAYDAATSPEVKIRAEFVRLARIFKTAACIQFCTHAKAYSECWKHMLPKGFAKEADRVYRITYGLDNFSTADSEEA